MTKQEILIELTNARIKKSKIFITVESPFEKSEYEFIDYSFIQLDNQFFIFNDYQSVMIYDYEFSLIQAKSLDSKDIEQHVKSIPKSSLNKHTSELDALTDNMVKREHKKEIKDDIF